MVSEKLAGRIIIVGLVCGFAWLGGCMANAFIESNIHAVSKK